MTTYYHVTPPDYAPDHGILSYGEAPGPWKFEGERFDSDIVCLFETIEDAREFVALWLPDGIIHAIDPEPDAADPLTPSRNEEGYLYVFRVPPAHIIGPVS